MGNKSHKRYKQLKHDSEDIPINHQEHNYHRIEYSFEDIFNEYQEYGIIDKKNRINLVHMFPYINEDNGIEEYDTQGIICGITIIPKECMGFDQGIIIFDYNINMPVKRGMSDMHSFYLNEDSYPNKLFYWYDNEIDQNILDIIDIFIGNNMIGLIVDLTFECVIIDEIMYRKIVGCFRPTIDKPKFEEHCKVFICKCKG